MTDSVHDTDETEASEQWKVTLPDGDTAALWDLPWSTVSTTARELNAAKIPVSWSALILVPLIDLTAARTLYVTVCKEHDQEPDTGLSARELYNRFNLAPGGPPTPTQPDGPSQWQVRLPDGTDALPWDLPEGVVAKLTKDLKEDYWAALVNNPLGTADRATKVYEALCEQAGLEPVTGLTTVEFRALWVEIPEDKPSVYQDGLPAPKADGHPTA